MKEQYLSNGISAEQPNWDVAVFYRWDKNGKFLLRDCYKPFCCKECGKLNFDKAISLGIESDIRIKGDSWDAIYTCDSQIIFSKRCLDRFRAMPNAKIEAWSIPNHTNYSLVKPKIVVMPPNDLAPAKKITIQQHISSREPFMQHGKRCAACKRYHELTISPGFVKIPVHKGPAAGLWLERNHGCPDIAWLVTDPIAEGIKKERFKGLTVSTHEYASGLTLKEAAN